MPVITGKVVVDPNVGIGRGVVAAESFTVTDASTSTLSPPSV